MTSLVIAQQVNVVSVKGSLYSVDQTRVRNYLYEAYEKMCGVLSTPRFAGVDPSIKEERATGKEAFCISVPTFTVPADGAEIYRKRGWLTIHFPRVTLEQVLDLGNLVAEGMPKPQRIWAKNKREEEFNIVVASANRSSSSRAIELDPNRTLVGLLIGAHFIPKAKPVVNTQQYEMFLTPLYSVQKL